LSEVAGDLQMALVIFIAVGDDDLRARLGYVSASVVSCFHLFLQSGGGRGTERTELGDKIASEKARATKDGRDVPGYRTATSRAVRNDRGPLGQGEQIVYSALDESNV
jgi:hypothetical protein